MELIIGFRDKWYPQLPSTYRYLCYTAMFYDLKWMHSSPLHQDLEDMIRMLCPNPEGLSYVPWKPPAERGAGESKATSSAAALRTSPKKRARKE